MAGGSEPEAATTIDDAVVVPSTVVPPTPVTMGPDSGFGSSTTHAPSPGLATDLADARQRWQTAALHDYLFRYEASCFCAGGTWLVHVVDDRFVAADALDGQGPVFGGPTVDGLFDTVDRALSQAGSIRVTYDATLGFPETASIDWVTDAADDENAFQVSDVEPGWTPTPPVPPPSTVSLPVGN